MATASRSSKLHTISAIVLGTCFLALVSVAAAYDAPANGSANVFELELMTEAALRHRAVCLDGSPGGYYFRRGFGSGSDKWVVYLEGGGWCTSLSDCANRAGSDLGSSKNYNNGMVPTYEGGKGILATDASINPKFYNWNKAYVKYCDGASFTGNVNHPVVFLGKVMYFAGGRIFHAALESLRARGMVNPSEAILAGCSAGALGVYSHCDRFAEVVGANKTRCFADAGFFINAPNTQSKYPMMRTLANIMKLQNTAGSMNQECLNAAQPDLYSKASCWFPNKILVHLNTPVFALNDAYDTWQLVNSWFKDDLVFRACIRDLRTCTPSQLTVIQAFRSLLISQADLLTLPSSPHGAYLTSCFRHCQSEGWAHGTQIELTSRLDAFNAWYEGKSVKLLMDAWPARQNGYCEPV